MPIRRSPNDVVTPLNTFHRPRSPWPKMAGHLAPVRAAIFAATTTESMCSESTCPLMIRVIERPVMALLNCCRQSTGTRHLCVLAAANRAAPWRPVDCMVFNSRGADATPDMSRARDSWTSTHVRRMQPHGYIPSKNVPGKCLSTDDRRPLYFANL
jgi:hypothetical protein